MTREPHIAEAYRKAAAEAEKGAPHGAPKPSVPAGEPEAPAGPGAPAGPTADPTTRPEHDLAGEAEADVDHERQLEHDLEELTAKAEKADEYLELAQRTRADFDNYRKRAAREAAAAQERGIAKLAKELLPAVDNLDRALAAAQSAAAQSAAAQSAATQSAAASDGADTGTGQDNGTATLISGIKLVHDDVIAALSRAGIEGFSPEGERFDPQLHEAIAQQPVDGAESGTVVEVYQRGYRLGDVVIRPARVVVAA